VSGPAPAVVSGAALVDALVANGVGDMVLSPGSRSAPVSVAAARRERQGRLRLQVRVDERSAAFVALGIAKASGVPAAVVCTSGTAAANLLPAIVEARYSGAPLVVITADRPPELRGRGASQTIDQVGMFDRYALGSQELPADPDPDTLLAAVESAVGLARRARGPVHLNLPLRAPLVGPTPEPTSVGLGGRQSPVGSVGGLAAAAAPPSPVAGSGDAPDLGGLPPHGVIVAGDIDVWDRRSRQQIADLAQQLGWPIVWEATSGLASAPTAVPDSCRLLADAARRELLRADAVITVGPFGLDRGVLEFVRSAKRHIAVRLRPRTDPPDPLATAQRVLDAVPSAHTQVDPTWVQRWRAAADSLPAVAGPGADMAAVVAATRSALTAADLLVLAPSLAIRAAATGSGPVSAVLANRGVNGIDGVVSTAWGAATAWRGGRTVALVGDLALLHDLNGLLVPGGEPRPDLTLVVADNDGGGIFGQLEQGAADYADVFERVFGTPHGRDLRQVLTAAGVPTVAVRDPDGVAAAVSASPRGVHAVLVRVGR
jgi:2-succinyl-5-enolpyruvyl-6-hydroxy-3-cyclohexene-1-carboxylate synthase